MRRYLDTARRYRWFIVIVLALTWIPGVIMAYLEYATSYEVDATIWTQRTSQQFGALSPQDPGLSTFVTPASEQAGVLMQLLQTRSFLGKVIDRTSLRGSPAAASDERLYFQEFSKRFRVDILGTNLFRLAYRARDPRTGPEVLLATLDERQEHLTAARAAATDAAASFYQSELTVAQGQVLDAQEALDRFDAANRPPLSSSQEYEQRQLRLALEDARDRASDLKGRIDRSTVMPGILQMADSLDFQVVDTPLDDVRPSGGLRPAAMIIGSTIVAGLALVMALIVGGTLLAGRVGEAADLLPAGLFASVPEVARLQIPVGRELRTALAAVAFAPRTTERGRAAQR